MTSPLPELNVPTGASKFNTPAGNGFAKWFGDIKQGVDVLGVEILNRAAARVETILLEKKVLTSGNALGAADLDTKIADGVYYQDNPGALNATNHYPSINSGTLIVMSKPNAAGAISQMFFSVTGQMFWRAYAGSSWTQWQTQTVRGIGGDQHLDNIVQPGLWVKDFAGTATPELGFPVQATCLVQVYSPQGSIETSANLIQELRVFGTGTYRGQTMRREKIGGIWQPWETIYPGTVEVSGKKAVVRDSAGRAKVAAPAADDDAATKGYVDSAISGSVIEAGSSRNFALYPGSIRLDSQVNNLPTIGGTVIRFSNLTTADQAKYFSSAPASAVWLSKAILDNSLGSAQSWMFGMTTDSQRIKINGSHGLQTGRLLVLVDGQPVDRGVFATFPTYSGQTSGIYLSFPHKRVRTIEILSRFRFWEVEHEAGAQFAPYRRITPKVGIIGDSWIDGTSQAPDSIGHIIQSQYPWNTAISAVGGSGYINAGQGKPYTDVSRLDAMAAFAPDLCVIYGTINDQAAIPSAVAAAAETMIAKLLAAKPAMKIILTGPQLKSAAHDANGAALSEVAAGHPEVSYHRAADFSSTGMTGPFDGAHPHPVAAAQIAQWLAAIIQSKVTS